MDVELCLKIIILLNLVDFLLLLCLMTIETILGFMTLIGGIESVSLFRRRDSIVFTELKLLLYMYIATVCILL